MTWLLWRQNRFAVAVAGALLAAVGVLVLATGLRMAVVDRDTPYSAMIFLFNISVAVPLVLGVFYGATCIARETEQSTHVLVWTQTMTRRRWLLGRIAVAVVSAVAIEAAMSALATWWSGPLHHSRFQPLNFDIEGVAPIAHALFAVALGIAAGAFFRRMLPAIGTTVAGYAVVRFAVEQWWRPHFLAAKTVLDPLGVPQRIADNAWMLNGNLVGPNGKVVEGPIAGPGTLCPQAVDRASMSDCMDKLGYHIKTTLQPASRYWPFQWIETGIFVAIAVALLAFAVVWTLRRDA